MNIKLKATMKFFAISILIVSVFYSCKKNDIDTYQAQQKAANLEKDFFNLPANTPQIVARIAETIKKQNDKFHFVNSLVYTEGLPVWDKAMIQLQKRNPGISVTNNITNATEDTVVIIPFVLENTEFVNSFIACAVADSISIRLFSARDYAQFGFHNVQDSISADKIALQTMLLEQNVFDHREYRLIDQRLFNHTENGVTIHPEFCTIGAIDSANRNIIAPSLMISITTCVEVTVSGGWLTGCPPGENCNQLQTFEVCDTWNIWIDENGGGWNPCSLCIPWWGPSSHPGNGGGAGGGSSGSSGSSSTIGWYALPTTIFSNINTPINAPDDPVFMGEFTIEPISPNAQSGRIIGKTNPRGNTEDMEYGNTCDASGILSNMPSFTDAQLFSEVNSLFHACTFFDASLQTVGGNMVDRFQNNVGGVFTDPILSQKAFESSAFKKFIIHFGGLLNTQLAAANWNINNVNTIDIDQGKRPRFNGTFNKFRGLQILVNDTEETQIELHNISINPVTHKWTASITVTIKDHFGLDKNDALTYQDRHAGFAAWWILQHCRGYKPFETQLKIQLNLISEPNLGQ